MHLLMFMNRFIYSNKAVLVLSPSVIMRRVTEQFIY